MNINSIYDIHILQSRNRFSKKNGIVLHFANFFSVWPYKRQWALHLASAWTLLPYVVLFEVCEGSYLTRVCGWERKDLANL